MDKLRDIFARVLSLATEKVSDETSPRVCPTWDSFNHLLLVVAIEKEMEVKFTVIDVRRMNSFKDVREIILRKKTEG